MPRLTRDQWLMRAVSKLTPIFAEAGHPLPPVKVTCDWPTDGTGMGRLGECWSRSASDDGINVIFIAPIVNHPLIALGILTHELVHAVDDCASGHRGNFVRIAKRLGMGGRPTSMHPVGGLEERIRRVLARMSPYPDYDPHSGLGKRRRRTLAGRP